MPVTNIAIIVFILAMMYMGSIQGLFSAFLHMMLVVAVGTLAFAIWEPVTLGLLMERIPLIAWTVGLLVPFALLLVIFRMVSDKLVPANMHFAGIVTNLGGAACGLVSGVLTAGIVLIGLGLLPFGPDLGGFQPLSVAGRGQVMPNDDGKLWVPVHSIAFNFYSGLSGGAFSSRTPMHEYMPDLDDQISLVRLRGENSSSVAAPKAVEVTGLYVQDTTALTDASPATATTLGGEFTRPGNQLVIVDTKWSLTESTYDGDRAIRISAPQIRLGIRPKAQGGRTQTIGPVGFTKAEGDSRVLYAFDADGVTAFGTGQETAFAWVFLVPTDQEPTFLFARKLRVDLPRGDDVVSDPVEILAILGAPPAPKTADDDGLVGNGDKPDGPTKVGERQGFRAGTYAIDISINNTLPRAISRNTTSGLQLGDGVVLSGNGTARKPPGNIGQRNRITAFDVPGHELMVKIKIGPDQGASLFGRARTSAAALNPILLKDSKGGFWHVSAYVWRKENSDQEIFFDAFNPIRSAKQLPISKMGPKDDLYLYFSITKDTELVSYQIGSAMTQDLEPPLVVQE